MSSKGKAMQAAFPAERLELRCASGRTPALGASEQINGNKQQNKLPPAAYTINQGACLAFGAGGLSGAARSARDLM
jgi:hypothetical protein